MTLEDENVLAVEGVRFFGEISASISHEIKNVLAIFNENSGLLGDLALLYNKGTPISAERLLRLSDSLSRQIGRMDGIVKNMNRFSHSADNPRELVDLGETVDFVLRLGGRLIRMKEAEFSLEASEKPVRVHASRFFLENLVWRCMVWSMERFRLDSVIRIFAEDTENGPRIRIQGTPDPEKSAGDVFPSQREYALSRMLGARLLAFPEKGEIEIVFHEVKSS